MKKRIFIATVLLGTPIPVYSIQISIPSGAHSPSSWSELTGVWNQVKDDQNEDYDYHHIHTYILQVHETGEVCESAQHRMQVKSTGEISKTSAEPICFKPPANFFPNMDRYIRSLSWVADDYQKMYCQLRDTFGDGAPWEATDWSKLSASNLRCSNEETDEITKNKLRTMEYGLMYKENPKVFKWAGMAAFASDTVGLGIRLADIFADKPLLKGVSQDFLSFLTEGNRAVYRDIYWQHEAYRVGGIAEIRRQKKMKNILSDQLNAWEKIEEGRIQNNQGKIWDGNKMLLKYEQETVLQPIYERYSKIGALISPFMYSPIPNNIDLFQKVVPFGNIGNYDERWKWIDKSMLPSWQGLSDNTSQSEVEIDYIIEANKGACKHES